MSRITSLNFALLSTIAGAALMADAEKGSAETKRVNSALSILSDETKVNAIKKAMPARKVYDSIDAAIEALGKASAATENFYGLPQAVAGLNYESGDIDPTFYESNKAVLAYVGGRTGPDNAKLVGIKGIVIYPMPSIESFLTEEGLDFVAKVVEKETALVAFRNFRESATLFEFQQGVDKTPISVAGFVAESTRGGNGLDTDTFDALWADMRAALKKDMPAIVALLPSKQEVIKAIRSQAYAEANHAALEAKGLFVWLAQVITQAASTNKNAKTGESDPLDTTAIASWIEGRSTLVLKKADEKVADFTVLDSFTLPTFAA